MHTKFWSKQSNERVKPRSSRSRQQDNINTHFKLRGRVDVDWINLAQKSVQRRLLVKGRNNFNGSIMCEISRFE